MFPSHREVLIALNNGDKSFTGTSGTIAWELEEQNVHLIVMWSVPYNLNIYNSYFGIGVVQLTTRFTRDMLPYWYKQMIENKQGRSFQRGVGGGHLVYKHEDFFVIGEFGTGYHPMLNIRYSISYTIVIYPIMLTVLCHGRLRTYHLLYGTSYTLTLSGQLTVLHINKGNIFCANILLFLVLGIIIYCFTITNTCIYYCLCIPLIIYIDTLYLSKVR